MVGWPELDAEEFPEFSEEAKRRRGEGQDEPIGLALCLYVGTDHARDLGRQEYREGLSPWAPSVLPLCVLQLSSLSEASVGCRLFHPETVEDVTSSPGVLVSSDRDVCEDSGTGAEEARSPFLLVES